MASVTNPSSATDQIPFSATRRDVPKPDNFILFDADNGCLGVKTSGAQRGFERVCVRLQRDDIVRKRGKHGAMQSI